MKKYIIILGNLDRRIIFLLIGLAMIFSVIPFVISISNDHISILLIISPWLNISNKNSGLRHIIKVIYKVIGKYYLYI